MRKIAAHTNNSLEDTVRIMQQYYRLTQLYISLSPAFIGWGKGGNVTPTGWQVTLCDPIWHVSSRSGTVLVEIVAQTAIRFLTFLTLVHLCPPTALTLNTILSTFQLIIYKNFSKGKRRYKTRYRTLNTDEHLVFNCAKCDITFPAIGHHCMPCNRYEIMLIGDRSTCVINLHEVVTWNSMTGSLTCDLRVYSV